MPVNRAVRIRFDRFLRTDTAVRQSVQVFGGTPNKDGTLPAAAFLEPTYDPVERTVTLRPDGNLVPGVLYTVRITRPSDDENGFGFRAWDGAELAKSYVFQFKTGTTTDPLEVGEASTKCGVCLPSADKRDPGTLVESGFGHLSGDCSGCHQGTDAPMALDMKTYEAIRRTAVGRIAHQTMTGPSTARAEESPALFGATMPVISSGQPGNSYVLYKMLMLSDWTSGEDGGENKRFLLPADQRPAGGYQGDKLVRPDDELRRIRSAFVAGVEMPPGGYDIGRLRTISRWIAEGAPDDASCPKLSVHCACDREAKPEIVSTGCSKPGVLGYTYQKDTDKIVQLTGCECKGPDCAFLFESAPATRTACTTKCDKKAPDSEVKRTESGGNVTCEDGSQPVSYGFFWDKTKKTCAEYLGCGKCKDKVDDKGAIVAACTDLYATCEITKANCDIEAASPGTGGAGGAAGAAGASGAAGAGQSGGGQGGSM